MDPVRDGLHTCEAAYLSVRTCISSPMVRGPVLTAPPRDLEPAGFCVRGVLCITNERTNEQRMMYE